MSANLIAITSDGGFTTGGNITVSLTASPAPRISGFSSVNAVDFNATGNITLNGGYIQGGVDTVVTDGINSIALDFGAQMDLYGFPFSGGGVRGQLTISDVTTPSEANGTWYYQSINTYAYQIYTDSTYSTLVDATGWSAYTGGGNVAITQSVPAANIVIDSNGYLTKFDNAGNLTLPGNIVSLQSAGLNVGSTYDVRIIADQTDNDRTWLFSGVDGTLTFPRDAVANTDPYLSIEGGENPSIISTDVSRAGPANLAIVSNYLEMSGYSGAKVTVYADSGEIATDANMVLITNNANTGNTSSWTFDTTSNLTLPGSLLVSNNAYISATNATGNVVGKTINIQAGAADQTDYYTTAGGNLNLIGGLGATNDGGGGGPGGSVNITAGLSADPVGNAGNVVINSGNTSYKFSNFDLNVTQNPPASPAPSLSGFGLISVPVITNGTDNVTINANSNQWVFDTTGNLVVSGSSGGFIKTVSNASIGIAAMDNGTNNPAQLLSINVGNGNATSIISAYATNATIQTNAAGAINTWKFDNAGNLTLPANTFAINYANGTQVSFSVSNISNGNSNVTIATSAGNVVTNVNGSTVLTAYSGGIKVGGSGILQSPGGAGSITLNNNGANIPTANITNTLNVTGVGGANITANLTAGNLATGGILSVTGTGVSSIAGNLNMNTKNITSLATPSNPTDAATKQYVDDVAQGLNIHDSCLTATTDTLATITGGTVSYDNGTSGVGATLTTTGTYTTIDGVNIASAGTRILVKNEANAAHNGIYTYTSSTVITRAADFNSVPEIEAGDFTFVTGGTQYDSTGWVQTTTVVTIGTDPIDFTQFSGAGTYQAGTGLTLTGSVFSVNVAQPSITSVGTLTSLSVSGNITGGNLVTGGQISAIGNATFGNIATTGSSGNITGANVVSATTFTATGNITGGNLVTGGVLSATGNANVGNIGAASGVFTTIAGSLTTGSQPNITATGTLTSLSVSGNINAANANLGNLTTSNYFSGSGNLLNNIQGANVSGAVSFATTANSVAGANVAGQVGNALVAGTVYTAAQPSITSVGSLTGITIAGTTVLQQSQEVFQTKTGATGVVTHDYSSGGTFYHTNVAGNFTANITNLNATSGRVSILTLVIAEGATPYICDAIQIAGVAQTVQWYADTVPVAIASTVAVMVFTIFNNSGTYTVLGQLASYG